MCQLLLNPEVNFILKDCPVEPHSQCNLLVAFVVTQNKKHIIQRKANYIAHSVGMLILVAARSMTWAFGRALAGIVRSNPTGDMDVCLLWVSCVVRSLRWTDHSSRGVLPSVVCLNECDNGTSKMRRPKPTTGLSSHKQTKKQRSHAINCETLL
jgi:hypothetical protein